MISKERLERMKACMGLDMPMKVQKELFDHIDEQQDIIVRLAQESNDMHNELMLLRTKTALTMGVGDGTGKLLIHGDYESIQAAQKLILDKESAEKEVAKLHNKLLKISRLLFS